jgi:APA family basic amino acid/polyamine antiporter
MAQLKRTLGLAECIFFGTGSILGAGIYAIVGKVAGFSGNMVWMSFLIASFTALMTAFSYAELSSMYPKSGGEYVYVKQAFNQKIGAAIGLIISLNGMVSGATVSLGFAGYFSDLLSVSMQIAALGIIGLVWLVNVTGVRESSTVNIVFTIIEMSGLAIVIYVAAPYLGKVDYFELPPKGINHLLLASALSFFAYIGFEEIVKLSEETKEPERTIPKALFIAGTIVSIIYVLVALCAVSAIPWEQLKESKAPLSDITELKLGATGATVVAVIALFSTSNTILSNMLGSSRVLLHMSKENTWLSKLSYVSPKRKTPVFALILAAVVMVGFAMIGKLEKVALIANLFIFITFLSVNISAIVLRKKQAAQERPYKMPLNVGKIPLLSVLGVIMTLLLFGYTIYGLSIAAV